MLLYFYKFVQNLYTKIAYIDKVEKINLNNSFIVLFNLKKNVNKIFYFTIENIEKKDFLHLYLKTTTIAGFKFIKTDNKLINFVSKFLKYKKFLYYFYIIFIILIFIISSYFELITFLKFKYFIYHDLNINFDKEIINFLIYFISHNKLSNVYLYTYNIDDLEHGHRIVKAYLANINDSKLYFKTYNKKKLNLFFIDVFYYQYITQNIFNVSVTFLNQFINKFMLVIIQHNYLILNIIYNNLNMLIFKLNIILKMSEIKEYLFWFSWGLFYNKIFYYYNLTYCLENFEFDIFNYFYYKLKNINFLFLKEDTYKAPIKEIPKRDVYLFIDPFFEYNNSSNNKRWICFQNYLNNDLNNFYNGKVSVYNYGQNPNEMTYEGSLFDSRKITNRRWLTLTKNYYFWLVGIKEEE